MRKAVLLFTFLINFVPMTAQNEDPWTEYMTPSDIHTLLAQYVGHFKMEITMSMGEGKEPAVIIVDSEQAMLLGGRFLEMKQKGNMMGMDYQAITTLGFNNTDKKFGLTTLTNMGTGTLSLFGDWDAGTRTATLYGPLTNPVTKGIISVKQIISFVDPNTIVIESFDKEGDAPEKKTVEYKFTRV
jgi:hypothetical protein